jgi:serine/threonine protein phosphatase PrpC
VAATSETDYALEAAVASDTGTERQHNEDFCRHELYGPTEALVAVADGVSGTVGGETASRMAIETTFRAYREQPAALSLGKRLARAAQQANIDVYDYAIVVTELRGMATTLTAIAIEQGELAAVHVGDSRLYLVRDQKIAQLTKDHTVTAEKVRLGLLSETRARHHPDRSTLTRSLGRELIVGLDRFTRRVLQGDTLVLCSDGLYNVLEESEIARMVCDQDASAACREMVEAANQLGTLDNLTVAIVRMIGPTPPRPRPPAGAGGILGRLRRLIGRPRGSG